MEVSLGQQYFSVPALYKVRPPELVTDLIKLSETREGVTMHTTMHSPKMTRSLQQISDKFGGSLGSLPALPAVNKIPNKLQLGDKLHTVQVKVGVTGEGRGEREVTGQDVHH